MASQFAKEPESPEARVLRSLAPSNANQGSQRWMTPGGEFTITVYMDTTIWWVLRRGDQAVANSSEPGSADPPRSVAGAIDQAVVAARRLFACWFPELTEIREERNRWIGCGPRVRAEVTGEAALDEEIACVRRELGKRRSVYPRLVAEKRMTPEAMARQIAMMERIQKRLEGLHPRYQQRATVAAAQPNLFEEA